MSKPKSFLSIIKPSSFRTLLQASASSASPASNAPADNAQETANDRQTVPIDATWFMPNSPRNALEEYQNERIPHARFFDLDKCSRDSPYPHMLPTQQIMAKTIEQLGKGHIKPLDNLVVYDKVGNFSSPRVAFTLKLFGYDRVYLLDNYLNYKNYDYPLDLNLIKTELIESETNVENKQSQNQTKVHAQAETQEQDIDDKHLPLTAEEFEERYDREVIEYEELVNLIEEDHIHEYLVLDARSPDRFSGSAPEPRPGLSSGHIPTAKNLPFTKFLDQEQNNQYKSRDELESIVKEAVGVEQLDEIATKYPKGIIVMCGTGVTACVLKLGLENVLKLQNVNVRLYDGSWTEWAMRAPEELIVKDV
ncbi:hypothetical protein LELG_02757 [Lodderomyces elongisporus NRRL YB-4239]|uniref:Sulfurtransferase n=1 Tax=Lodderomyces elongisporus (strain ATCC 11503 / CBS 2605 / JCM 1781 / NBRC 1676 / NRRL YB-4239) TaxID=379508 RepID=A5DZH0_LODEL|nr:hypothetical protein LELG_02757 [Lodderomyces elongisporus NRRL YB-4239]